MTLKEMEKRLRTLEDTEAIKELHRQYVYWINSRDWDEILNCFTDDAWVHIGGRPLHRGKKELEKLFKIDIAKQNEKTNGCHFVMQPIISVDGNRATGSWFMCIVFAINLPTGPTLAWRQGRHDCEYIKLDGKWKFNSVKFTNTAPDQIRGGTVFR
jgi:ketosteroid isomerase-like protein